MALKPNNVPQIFSASRTHAASIASLAAGTNSKKTKKA